MKVFIGVFAIALAITIVASFPGTVEAINPDETLLGLFPANLDGVGYIDVAGIRDNPIILDLLDDQDKDGRTLEPMEDFTALTGLDLRTDLDQVMLGRSGEDTMLIVARVSYDPLRIEQFFEDRGSPFASYAGRTIYRPDPDEEWEVTFTQDLMIAGTNGAVGGALDRLATPGTTALDNQEIIDGIASIDEGSQVWAVGEFGKVIPPGLAPPMATELIDSLKRGTYQMRFDAAVTGRAVGEFGSAETARRTRDLLRGFVAFGKMQVYAQQDLIQLLDGVMIDNRDTAVHIDFSADGELLRRISESGIDIRGGN